MLPVRKELQSIYGTIEAQINRFESVHGESIKYLSAMVNTCSRADSIRQATSLGVLAQFRGAKAALIRQHFASAERLIQGLTTSLGIFEEICVKLRRAADDALALLPKAQMLGDAASQRSATSASISEAIQWADTVAAMAKEEFLAKKMTLSLLKYDDMTDVAAADQAWSQLSHLHLLSIKEWISLCNRVDAN